MVDFERTVAREFAARADQICRLILAEDYPLIDVQIERGKLREEVEQSYPDRLEVYDRIYESRFDRLIEQFRPAEADE